MAARAGRSADEVTLVAVTKTWPAQLVIEAYDAGLSHFGENRPEELAAKIARDAERAKGSFSMDYVSEALEEVYDPEIPVSIVELGLVYRTEEVMLDDGRRRIEIDMTMTAPGCGMGDVLTADAKRAAEAVPGVDEAEVQMVFSPPWGAHMMSDAVKLQLGLL